MGEICLHRFARGENIYREGEPLRELYFLVKGQVKVFRTHHNGKVSVVEFASAFDILGELELVNARDTTISVQALRECHCLGLSMARCREPLLRDYTFLTFVARRLGERLGDIRQGKLVGLSDTKDITEKEIASMMVGRPVLFDKLEKTGVPGETMISVENLSVRDNRGLVSVRGVSLEARAGEVLGIAAIEGNGQSELLEAITGMRPAIEGRVRIRGTDALGLSPGQIRQLGLAHVPEDRLATGVDPLADVADNLIAGRQREREFNIPGLRLRRSSIERYVSEVYKKFDIRGAGIHTPVGSMSGGNMQKVVVAREFSHETPVLVISNPSRGIDIGAIEFIHTAIIDKRNEGCAILLSSADLDEIFRLSDRIVTMYEGQITGEFRADEITKEEIGYYMTGSRRKEAEEAHEAAN